MSETLYLQNIADNIPLSTLPNEWTSFDTVRFSDKKNLFNYQSLALENAIKILHEYFKDYDKIQDNLEHKKQFFKRYQNISLSANLDFQKISSNPKVYKIFEEYSEDYPVTKDSIPFYCFINRMSFWMATGSGKTVIIIKLLELLGNLIEKKLIPAWDILFLTCKDELLTQFKNHVKEFNDGNSGFKIALHELKEYEKIKNETKINFEKTIQVFYYRSDLLHDVQKDKIIDFRNYDNNGNWYILLDEAHKGDKEESKRQNYYSILSRNGFLFNFSATFTDKRDYVTCAYNFNLQKFIQEGYGKRLYISQHDISLLGEKEEYSEYAKQKIIVKILLLHTLIKQNKPEGLYHKPLILTLVNSVNTEDSDLYLFFKEIEKIAVQKIPDKILQDAKKELIQELQQGKTEFDSFQLKIDGTEVENITYSDILEHVFNAKVSGKIEVIKIPGNKQELIFKLASTDKPFALIKIGDISEWIKNKLSGYEIVEKLDNESVFKMINEADSDINLLVGSRAFYEGWDSNRPNILLYINIGKGTDAQKFVLQSIGRGIRIEPLPNKRKRLDFLYHENHIDEETYEKAKQKNTDLIETLFVYGTKAENIRQVIQVLKTEQQFEYIGDLFEINPDVVDKDLLIPMYRESKELLIKKNPLLKYEINEMDYEMTKTYTEYVPEKVMIMKYDTLPNLQRKITQSFLNAEQFYKIQKNIYPIRKPDILMKRLIQHFSLYAKEFADFKQLENEIIHFKQIAVSKDKFNDLKQKIEKIKKYPQKAQYEIQLDKEFDDGKINTQTYKQKIRDLDQEFPKQIIDKPLIINYIQNHYYIPVILSENEKVEYIKHIIKTQSEVEFIKDLESYLQKENNFFKQLEWWYFSKIDEITDEVYIPYYNSQTSRIEKFKPDFIFWFKQNERYIILFVDPKSTQFSSAYKKIDGYSNMFEYTENNVKQTMTHLYKDIKIEVKLLMRTYDLNAVPDNYKAYWFENIEKIQERIFR